MKKSNSNMKKYTTHYKPQGDAELNQQKPNIYIYIYIYIYII